MVEVDAVECDSISWQDARVEYVKDKSDMLKISQTLSKPILRHKERLLILDGDTAYVYVGNTPK
jgi:hypothetical protein